MTWDRRFQAGSGDPVHKSGARTRRLNTMWVLPQPLPEGWHKELFHTLSWFHPRTQTPRRIEIDRSPCEWYQWRAPSVKLVLLQSLQSEHEAASGPIRATRRGLGFTG
jgi:hypothetical protein